MQKFVGTGVALITPFKEDLSVDFDALVKLVNFNILQTLLNFIEAERGSLRMHNHSLIYQLLSDLVWRGFIF